MRIQALIVFLFFAFVSSFVSAQINYDEASDGDLGDPFFDPAVVPTTVLGILGLGNNTVTGALDNTFTFLDRDSFTFTVAQGQQLDALSFTSLNGGGRFFALSNKDTHVSTNSGGGNYYASLIGDDRVGVNLLDGTVNDSGGSGGSGPLVSGDYTFWFQETDFSTVNYSLSLATSSAVPEPRLLFLLLFGSGLNCFIRRRKHFVV